MPMSPRLLRPRATGFHPEAQAWRNAVIANGGTVSGSTLTAVSNFCRSIDAAGIRDRFYRLNLCCGTGISSALVPLFRGPSRTGTQYGGTTDTNNNFVTGDYNETGASAGFVGNSTNKYLNTGYPANTLTAANSHLGLGLLATDTGLTGDKTGMGAWNGGSNIFELRLRDRGGAVPLAATMTRFATVGDRFGDSIASASLAAGNLVAAWPNFFRNGVQSGTTATSSADFPSAVTVFVGALNNSNSSQSNAINGRFCWYSIGATMTAAQALSFHDALAAFNTALSRS